MAGIIQSFSPTWKLIDSVASQAPDPINDMPYERADIPDKFASTEQPKTKFTFTLKFIPRDDLRTTNLYFGDEAMEDMAFPLKQSTRPQPTIDYRDVNFYNYRTKVATKTDYGTMNVTFYEDSSQKILGILTAYLNAISPISVLGVTDADRLDEYSDSSYASTIGELNNKYGLFKAIRLTHYHDYGNNEGYKYTTYDFINPKVTNFVMDELDMSVSDVSTINMTFSFDTVNIYYKTDPNGVVNVGKT